MFQFLIGRLGTGKGLQKRCACREFQFLIGRLGTGGSRDDKIHSDEFQFLIGRLGTVQAKQGLPLDICFNSS